jgi:acetylornithine deacetylase/succinyl-diaminopimelate desuccinylase-like protein
LPFFAKHSQADEADHAHKDGPQPSPPAVVDLRTASATVARLAAEACVHDAFQWFRTHEREIADFQLAVTAVPAPPFGEQARGEWYAQQLAELGYVVERDALGNVFASAEALDDDTPVVAISAHLDTVFSEGKLDVRREHHKLVGPGISDNGAGLAGLWAIASALKKCGIQTSLPLLLLANVGEEGAGDLRGMRAVFTDPRWSSRIASLLVVDGSGVETIVTEALGSRRFAAQISGPGGHSWSDYGVPNPIVALSRAIVELSNYPLPAFPRTTLSIGIIEGGTSINAIPERASMRVDIRSTESSELDRMESLLRLAVENAARDAETFGSRLEYSIDQIGDRPAASLRPDSPLLFALMAADAQLGIRSRTERASTDANIPLSLGIDAVAIGAGGSGAGAHTLHEWYDPAGRDLALRRVLLVLLALAGLKC